MSNFAKGFRRARTGRLSGCDRVPERPVPRPEKRIAASGNEAKPISRPRRRKRKMQTGLTTTTRSREPSRKPGDRSIGTTAASGPPNRKRRKPLSISALQGQTESGRAQRRKRNRIFNENTTIFSMEIKARFDHFNINVTDLERSLAFYDRALGLKEISRKQADDGSFILAYLGDGETGFRLELTWLRDHAATPYELGENESHLCVRVAGDYEAVRAYHKELGCVCFENHEMGLYFINDPDDYWIEVLPLNH
jgi:lactoylglutathione lyase